MGADHPYLYTAPKAYNEWDPYNGFNPKAVSQATFAPVSPQKPKQDGPLLNFNRHPDSYLITPYGQTDAQPMHKNTRKRVMGARKIQLAFRIIQLIGAVGLLVCVICIKVPKSAESWIVRIPPAVDTLIVVYSIYHLASSSKNRTPTNSASYHAFVTVMDVGLIPFYIFITMLGNAHYHEVVGTKDRWTSLFDSDSATDQLIQVVWMATAVMACLHSISLMIDLYLFIMFRKIMNLPPDMNPLEEDKLTRRKTKHKYKNSEVTLTDNRHMSSISGTTVGSSESPTRASRASRGISFTQSRTGGDNNYSPHNPKTARMSQTSLANGMYQQGGMVTSRVNLHNRTGSVAETAYSNRMSPMPSNPTMQKRNSLVSSVHSFEEREPQRNSREDLQNDNWFVVGDGSEEEAELDTASPYTYDSHPPSRPSSGRIYQPVAHESPRGSKSHLPNGHPLHMNPPTPRNHNPSTPRNHNPPTPPPQPIAARIATQPLSPPDSGFSHHVTTHSPNDSGRSRTMVSDVSAVTASSHYSVDDTASDFTSSGILNTRTAPSRQLYGDLASAMRGVRQHDVISPRPKSMVGSLHWAAASEAGSAPSEAGTTANSRYHHAPSKSMSGMMESVSGTVVRKNRSPVSELDEDDDVPLGARYGSGYGRVVSRTGVEVMDSHADLGMMGRRREVSGKVAEEGRAGSGGGWLGAGLWRRTSGMKS